MVRGRKTGEVPSLEQLLLTRVALAEKMKKDSLLEGAYSAYLKESKDKTKYGEVFYQKVYRFYKKGDYKASAKGFRKLALMNLEVESKSSLGFKRKAADLALDSLVLLKDDLRLEKWAREFSQLFPLREKEYRIMVRKSLFNQAAQLASGRKKDLKKSWGLLSRVELDGASEAETLDYYRNKLVLAEKLKRFSEAREVAQTLLSMKNLSEKDRQFALGRKAWLAEIFFDFEEAIEATENLNVKGLRPAQKILKLAMFAELSGRDATPYYRRYLGVVRNRDRARVVALKLVESSDTPLEELLKQRPLFGEQQRTIRPHVSQRDA